MQSFRCSVCGLLQFAHQETCKRCGQAFNAAPHAGPYQTTQTPYATPGDAGGYYAPPSPGYGAAGGYGGYQSPPRENYNYRAANAAADEGPARNSMICGILGLTLCGLLAPVALILGFKAKRKIKEQPMEFGGQGYATAGIVMGGIGTIFSLILVPGIIAAIAIPNLLASRRAANESAAISSLRTIAAAEVTYQATAGRGQFGALRDLGASSLLDSQLASGTKSGYRFALTVQDGDRYTAPGFTVTATPIVTTGTGQTGIRSFYVDESQTIRYSNNPYTPATADDTPIR
jgi:type II secretory pathway pseudopilin PulG